jgi:hypothetical protein
MKTKKNSQDSPLTGQLLDQVVQLDKAHFAVNFPVPSVSEKPLTSPDLYQDDGGGYNSNFTFPQQ